MMFNDRKKATAMEWSIARLRAQLLEAARQWEIGTRTGTLVLDCDPLLQALESIEVMVEKDIDCAIRAHRDIASLLDLLHRIHVTMSEVAMIKHVKRS